MKRRLPISNLLRDGRPDLPSFGRVKRQSDERVSKTITAAPFATALSRTALAGITSLLVTVTSASAVRADVRLCRESSGCVFYGDEEIDIMVGAEGSDLFYGGAGDDQLEGRGGGDFLFGQDGDDRLDGGVGDDYLSGGHGADVIHGGDGNDYLDGDEGDDHMYGDLGHDIMFGGDGNDFLDGSWGNDYLSGGSGSDTLVGGPGGDIIEGGPGSDSLTGGGFLQGESIDILYGGPGDTILDVRDGSGGDKIYTDSSTAHLGVIRCDSGDLIIVGGQTIDCDQLPEGPPKPQFADIESVESDARIFAAGEDTSSHSDSVSFEDVST